MDNERLRQSEKGLRKTNASLQRKCKVSTVAVLVVCVCTYFVLVVVPFYSGSVTISGVWFWLHGGPV